MINEVMAKAVTGIDDELILEAQQITKTNRLRPVYSICALVACLVLVFTFIFGFSSRNAEPALLINGITIKDSPQTVDTPLTAQARAISYELPVHLKLNIKERTKIKISKGTMSVVSANNTDTLYYTGTQYTTDIPVNIHWIVDGSDIQTVYTLTLNDGEIVYTLSYDEGTSLWSICKQ